MANFKVVVSDPKTKKAFQKEIDQGQSGLLGKKIGEKISGNNLGMPGYELEITGGSDNEGFPMRRDVDGTARKKILLSFPPGFHPKTKGQRKRKSIRGNTISQQISQVNLKVTAYGNKPLEHIFGTEKANEEKPKKEPEKEKKEVKPEEKEKTGNEPKDTEKKD